MSKIDINSMTAGVLAGFLGGLGEPKYRAGQVFSWLHGKNVANFDEMTTLSKPLRVTLDEKCYISGLKIQKKLVSEPDGTVKYLYALHDGNTVESVVMTYRHGVSLCVSTQAGCRQGCAFCASALGGLERNLAASEMLGQLYAAQKDLRLKISSVVLMGMGEPLDNFENTLDFLDILSHPGGQNMSLRHVSLSTCGLVDKIDLLAEKRLPLTLSVSLHAADDELRSRIMPVNKKWGVDELLASCRRYFEATGRRISFEYALIGSVNDSDIHAKKLAEKLKGFICHVNLIPVNEVRERGYSKSVPERVAGFKLVLDKAGINATVRRELGVGINAACGQLRRESDITDRTF